MSAVGEQIGGFSLGRILKTRGETEVWKATRDADGIEVALKLASSGSPDAVRLRREEAALSRVTSRFTVAVAGFSEAGGRLLLAFDWCRGGTLKERLAADGPFPVHAVRDIAETLLGALRDVHDAGVVHRDLKPSNILLDANGHAVLADLGVAHIADANLAKRLGDTATPNPTLVRGSPFVGTPRYAAPEQLTGDDVTPATDIYALGVVIEQLFGGKVPLSWRPMLKRMTQARPGFRISSVRQVRRHLLCLRLFPWLLRLLAAAIVILAASLTWQAAQPDWIEVTDTPAEVITLGGGHYFQHRMHYQPIAVPPPTNVLTATNAIDRQFQKMFLTRCKRRPIRIQGEGTLKCPDVTFCEVHLGPGVKFITSGRCKPDGYSIKEPIPPSDADWDNRIGYPAYVVERGAELVFTDNDSYPDTLVRRQ